MKQPFKRTYTDTIKKVNQRIGTIKHCFSYCSTVVIISLYATHIRPILDNCPRAWIPWLEKDIDGFENAEWISQDVQCRYPFTPLSARSKAIDLKETYKIINSKYLISDNAFFFQRNISNLSVLSKLGIDCHRKHFSIEYRRIQRGN